MLLPIEICSSTTNSVTIIGYLLKTLDFNTYQGVLFLFLIVIPGYFNGLIYEIMKRNISKIKHHSYEVLTLQVYLTVLV